MSSVAHTTTVLPPKGRLTPTCINLGTMLLMLVLMGVSMSIGVADFSWSMLLSERGEDLQLLLVSRLPRTLAIILTGASMAVAGMVIQAVLKNRFVEPSFIGATQCASLGILLSSLFVPQLSMPFKMLIATGFAVGGIIVFMRLIRWLPVTDYMLLPLVGIVFSGIIDAITTFIAYETESMQLLSVWQLGDFSAVVMGRYEMLWLTGLLCAVAYVLADKLTIVGMGDNFAKNLGINRERIVWVAIVIVAMISALVVITVGTLPFIGLVVPNIISQLMGDRLRASLPALALTGASLVLACDIIGRVIRYPFEIPVANVFGVVGSLLFLYLLLRKS